MSSFLTDEDNMFRLEEATEERRILSYLCSWFRRQRVHPNQTIKKATKMERPLHPCFLQTDSIRSLEEWQQNKRFLSLKPTNHHWSDDIIYLSVWPRLFSALTASVLVTLTRFCWSNDDQNDTFISSIYPKIRVVYFCFYWLRTKKSFGF